MRTRLEALAAEHGKAVLGGPVYDTIKLVQDGIVQQTLDRERLRWPLAWACRDDVTPAADPPDAAWFEGAAVMTA